MSSPSPELQVLQREQIRLRVRLAIVLLATICAFALFLAWLAQDNPLQPLLLAKVSFIGLAVVYVVGAGIAAIYARWIGSRREPLLRTHQRAANKEHQ